MNRIAKTALALGVAAAVLGTAGIASARGFHRGGDCAGGSDMGMMGGPMGGMLGRGANIDKQLTPDDAKAVITGFLAMHGNKRLKAGNVQEKDAGTILAEVVTVDNSLVQRFEIDRKTGRFTPVQ